MKVFKNEISQLFALFILAVFMKYLLPGRIGDLFFLLTLPAFWFSTKNHFWFAFFFLLTDAPGWLFSIADPEFHMSTFSIFPGVGRDLFIFEFFILLAIVKALMKKSQEPTIFYRPLFILLIYFLFLFLYSFALGISTMKVFNVIRRFLPYTLIFSMSRLMPSENDFVRFFRLMFPLVFLALMAQVYEIIYMKPLATLLGGNVGVIIEEGDLFNAENAPQLIRTITSPYINIATFIGALYFYTNRKNQFNKTYLISIILVDIFLVIMSGTRGWMVAYAMMFLIFSLTYGQQVFFIIRRSTLPIFLFIIFLVIFPNIISNLRSAIARFSTIETMMEGDLSAGNTVARYTEYTPFLMDKWSEKPLLGWGFSDQFFAFSNPHAGYPNLLMNTGIIGFLLFIYFFYYYISKIFFIRKRFPVNSKSLMVFLIGLAGYMLINASSTQFFGYLGSFHSGQTFALVLFLVFTDRMVKTHIRLNLKLKKELAV